MEITLLKNDRIDRDKYDQCISRSPYGTVYALSWYLDVVAPDWQLLLAGDYEYVMPLPVKYKLKKLSYVIQPSLCQQLGLFSDKKIDEETMSAFIRQIRCPYILLQLNPGNLFPHRNIKTRPNYLLRLDKPYEEIRKGYRSNTRRELKDMDRFDLSYEKDTDMHTFLDLVETNSEHYGDGIFPVLKSLAMAAVARNSALFRLVRKADSKELLAGVFFLRYKNRYYYLSPVSTRNGKHYRAMRFLLDRFIEEHANTSCLLDFEGSTISSVARFYESFGSTFETYPRYFFSCFPWVSKLKKLTLRSIF